ncbi:MAG: hypothetical protein ISR76_04960 [Planctomycetes bacterium]|nr:hypothetical protein [Planctomycetota bacterium]
MHPVLLAMLPLLPLPGGSPWQGGYGRDLRGEVIPYASALPEVDSALLVRSIDAGDFIEWETQPAPAALEGETVPFVWLFGLDANPERHAFELSVDGAPVLSFRNPARPSLEAWEVAGESGARLQFRPTLIDRHDDVFGFAVLSLPRRMVTPGQPLRLKVVGEGAGSRVWYMTFRASPEAGAKVTARDALLRGHGEPWQPVVVEVVHLGAPTPAVIETSWSAPQEVELKLGANRFELPHPEATQPVLESVGLRAEDGTAYEMARWVAPVRRWTLHLVQHSHTDLGYTRPQTEILPDHLRYIDYALDYCDLTDDYPDDARFRWTCEAAWPVREWLRYRPAAQIERLRRRVAEGRIELTAMFANMSELLDERGCAASLEPVALMREHGLPVESAMQDDVNGISWVYADLLPELGVRYLSMGEHGHRALIPFDVPTAFWWESPSGSRLLAWRPDHYNTGNFWGIHTGRMETVEPALFRYLEGLEERGYPRDAVAVQYSGVFLDNAPPGIVANGFIRDWNERFVWPRLRSSTVSELPRRIGEESGAELPVHRAAWPDWWSDGVGSAPREAAAARRTQDELTAVEGMLAMAALAGVELPDGLRARQSRTREQLVVYGEHTYGAAESVTDPGAENSQVQWAEKSAFVWDAVKETAILKEAAFGLLQGRLPRTDAPTITVVNTLGWPRGGLARVFIDKELLPPGRAFRVVDDRGEEVPAQLWQAKHDGNWWALQVADVPAFGWRSYRLELLDGEAAGSPPVDASGLLENAHYRLRVDPARGGVVSLYDKELGRELVDAGAEWGFGQLVHEQLGNRWQLESKTLDDFQRAGLEGFQLGPGDQGPLWRSFFLRGRADIAPEENGVEVEVRLYELEKKVEFRYRLRKRPETAPEGLYAAFPFALPDSTLRYETVGGTVDPETDQIPRTSSDWQCAQRFVTLTNAEARVTLSSPEILLHQFGGIQLGRFQDRAVVERPHIYSWLLNNYWVTNFLASQDGELFWSQAITSGPADGEAAGPVAAARFGWDHQMPLLTRVLPPGRQAAALPAPVSLLGFAGAEVVLVGARCTAEGEVHLQLRELAGRSGELQVSDADGRPLPAALADALGRPLGPAAERNPVRPVQSFHLLLAPR